MSKMVAHYQSRSHEKPRQIEMPQWSNRHPHPAIGRAADRKYIYQSLAKSINELTQISVDASLFSALVAVANVPSLHTCVTE